MHVTRASAIGNSAGSPYRRKPSTTIFTDRQNNAKGSNSECSSDNRHQFAAQLARIRLKPKSHTTWAMKDPVEPRKVGPPRRTCISGVIMFAGFKFWRTITS